MNEYHLAAENDHLKRQVETLDKANAWQCEKLKELEMELKKARELHAMQLSAISVQAASNTPNTVDNPLSAHPDYITQALKDVNAAIHREIAWRERLRSIGDEPNTP